MQQQPAVAFTQMTIDVRTDLFFPLTQQRHRQQPQSKFLIEQLSMRYFDFIKRLLCYTFISHFSFFRLLFFNKKTYFIPFLISHFDSFALFLFNCRHSFSPTPTTSSINAKQVSIAFCTFS